MAFNISYIYQLKDKYSAKATKIKSKTDAITKSFGKLQKKADVLGKKLGGIGKNMSLKVTAPIVAAGVAAAITFGNFEEGLGNTLTLLDSNSPVGYAKKLEKVAKGALKAGFATEDTTKSLFDSVSALGAGKAALEVFDEAQILAIGGASTLGASVKGLAGIMNAYGRDTANVKDIAGAFFSAQKGGETTVQALGMNITKVASIAKDAGVDIDTLMATVAQLTLTAPSTEIAITQLKGAINALTKPSVEAEKILKAKGIAFNTVKLRADGLIPTLEKLSKLAKSNPNLITKMIPELEARAGVSALGVEQIANLKNILAGIVKDRREGTGLTDAFIKKNEEFNRTMAKMAGNIKVAAISLGAVMAPTIKRISEFIAVATTKFVEFSEAHPAFTKVAVAIATIVAIIGPLLVALGFMLALVGPIVAGYAAIAAVVSAAIPVIVSISAGIAIFGAIATAIWLLIKNWGKLKQAMQNILDFWTGVFLAGVEKVKSVVQGLIDLLPTFLTEGGSLDINVNRNSPEAVAARTMTNNSRLDGEITVNAAPGTVKSVRSKQSGANVGNLGLNLAGI